MCNEAHQPLNDSVQEILSGITSDNPEAFLGAGELLRAYMFGLEGTAVLEPYASMFAAAPLSEQDVHALQKACLKYLSDGNIKNAPAAAHAITQLGDQKSISTLRNILNERLGSFALQGYTVGQLLLALDRCGENATSGTSYSSDEFEKNFEDARQYLFSRGFEGPW